MKPRLLIVGGVMRGGTTLTRTILDSHPDITLFRHELRALVWCGLPMPVHLARMRLRVMMAKRWIRQSDLIDDVQGYIRSMRQDNGLLRAAVTLDMSHKAFIACLGAENRLYVGDKYPDYVFHCTGFLQKPDCRVILIVRDPRDVIASIFQRVRGGDWAGRYWVKQYSSIEGACNYWNSAARTMHGLNNSDSGALVIRYEDLVTSRESSLKRMSDYLELDHRGFDESMGHTDSLGKHKQSLSADEVQEIEQRTADLMATFNYR